MTGLLPEKRRLYQSKVDFKVLEEDFRNPGQFIKLHEELVGTVLREINDQLRCYDHIIYFGCMLFFHYLTDDEINNGPVIWKDMQGNAHCF